MDYIDDEEWVANLEQNIKNSKHFGKYQNQAYNLEELNNLSGLDLKIDEQFEDAFRRDRANSKRYLREEIELGSGGEYVLL